MSTTTEPLTLNERDELVIMLYDRRDELDRRIREYPDDPCVKSNRRKRQDLLSLAAKLGVHLYGD